MTAYLSAEVARQQVIELEDIVTEQTRTLAEAAKIGQLLTMKQQSLEREIKEQSKELEERRQEVDTLDDANAELENKLRQERQNVCAQARENSRLKALVDTLDSRVSTEEAVQEQESEDRRKEVDDS